MKVSILGCQISVLSSYRDAYVKLVQFLRNNPPPSYITVNNVHTVIEATRDPTYQKIINGALMALPDGRPLSIVGRWKGVKNMERIFGPTFLEKTLEWGQEDGIRHFFFGGSEETLRKIRRAVNERFPAAKIAGMIAPPFRSFTDLENATYLQQMKESKADIIWVALGAPKQEKWMYQHFRHLEKGIMVGIGAGFDYLAGNTRHAPNWMKRYALEWVYRLIQEPGRLWKRYLITNSLFILFLLLEFLGLKNFNQ